MLQNTVAHLKLFKRVKLADQLEIANGRGPLPYQDYATLLQSDTATYDHDSSSSPHRGTCLLTNIHDTCEGPKEYEYEPNPVSHDVDINDCYFGSFLEANSTNFCSIDYGDDANSQGLEVQHNDSLASSPS